MSDMSRQLIAENQRTRDARQRRLVMASLSFEKIKNQEMVIRNVSKRGLGGATQGLAPAEGARVSVTLPNGNEIHGIVRWREGPCFGLALDFELHAEALADVRIKMRSPPLHHEPAWEVSRLHRVVTPRTDASCLRRV